ncbi:glycosyltransferase [Fusobacterium mortiferum]|uniref:glycosyltransferase n=1 Tax=Fusobacterium mortiferum TaxID=850 RepID=UPI00195A4522|nr:glycosyltransferase [Fusobacterium mortiferum]
MEERIKISVVIPMYNVETYVRKCIESVLNQTYKNLEVIVVNDGSKDNSLKIVKEYIFDKRLKIIDKENMGVSSARNRGIEEASGDYITFVDSDDYLDKNIYKNIVKKLKDEDIVIFNFEYFNNNGQKRKGIHLAEEYSYINKGEKFLKKISNVCWNKLYKYEYIKNKRFISGIIFEDIFWSIDTLLFCENVKFINEIGYYYREERKGSIATSNKIKTKQAIEAYEKIEKHIIDLKVRNYINLTISQKLRLEIEKIRMLRMLEKEVDIKDLTKELKEYVNCFQNEDKEFFQKQIREILRYSKTKNIKLLDKVYWKYKIYDFKVVKRILKNKILNYLNAR